MLIRFIIIIIIIIIHDLDIIYLIIPVHYKCTVLVYQLLLHI